MAARENAMADDTRASSDEMDEQRKDQLAYQYLCHLEETRLWLSACINEDLPSPTELEESLRNGVYLAKVAHFFAPDVVPLKKVYDIDQSVYRERGLNLRHTDNINYWLEAMKSVGLPEYFFPDAVDLYEKRNLPKVIYCLHALSLLLFKLGRAPKIEDLVGKITFSTAEIDQVRQTLEEYGIELPTFSKIGGILTKEMSVDDAALHVAVILINKTVDEGDPNETLEALRQPTAELQAVREQNAERYQDVLRTAKAVKVENHLNRSHEVSYVPDVYDQMLNQAEIQGYVFETNMNVLLEKLDEAIDANDLEAFRDVVTSPDLNVGDVVPENVPAYLRVLNSIKADAHENNNSFILSRSDIQFAIAAANEKVDQENNIEKAVLDINACLQSDNADATFDILKQPTSMLPEVYPLAKSLYHKELSAIRREAEHDLDHSELTSAIRILNAIAEVNIALKTKGSGSVVESLRKPDAHIAHVDNSRSSRYAGTLLQDLAEKSKRCSNFEFLTHAEIQDCVNAVNSRAMEEHDRNKAVEQINSAIHSGNFTKTVDALLNKAAMILCVDKEQAVVYQHFLSAKQASVNDAPLSVDEIQHEVNSANSIAAKSNCICISLATVHMGVVHNSAEDVLSGLNSLEECKVIPGLKQRYLEELQNMHKQDHDPSEPLEWFSHEIKPGLHFNFNLVTLQSEWSDEPYSVPDPYISVAKLQNVVARLNEKFISNEFLPLWVELQARIRGYLVRLDADEQLKACLLNARDVVIVPKTEAPLLQEKPKEVEDPFLVKLQARIRGFLSRRRLHVSVCHPEFDELYGNLLSQAQLPLIREFLHMLEVSDHDFSEEQELQKVKAAVVAAIRHNRSLEKDVDSMDVKIGLLVRNCITLEQVMHHSGKKAKVDARRYQSSWLKTTKSLTSLSKESREKLAAYQNLFYLLQTNPTYLAKLIFAMPSNRSNKFVESVIYSIYNYGSTPREECLLLKLFQSALEEEVRLKVRSPADVLTGYPTVLKMVVEFYRTARGQSCLKELLEPLVKSVIDNEELNIDLSPVDIYKQWINETETSTGSPSGMPYDVSPEEAIQHPEVQKRLSESVIQLEKVAGDFCSTIVHSNEKVPYGMRYIARVLRSALRIKFPNATDLELLKVVGNVLYYRYINSAIVAPDTFDIIQLGPGASLTMKQRKHLGLVARVLQCAASGKTYENDDKHFSRLTTLTQSCNLLFQRFFQEACDVESPEEHFNVDSYTEAAMLSPPLITLTLQELHDMHQLLLEHRSDVAPEQYDPLHPLLDDIGKVPSEEELLGGAFHEIPPRTLANTEICLTLVRRFKEDEDKAQQLYSDAKQAIIELIRGRPTALTIREVIYRQVTNEEEELYSAAHPLTASKGKLADVQRKTLVTLEALTKLGRIPANCDFQDLLRDIARDIAQQKEYRRSRKEELDRLRDTKKELDRKTAFCEEKLSYYQQYVDKCLKNLTNRKGGKKTHDGTKLKPPLKYNGARLHDKGVLLSVSGLEPSQLKSAAFEIIQTDRTGIFTVKAKFHGVPVDTVDIDIQDLLQKQYDGVAVIDVFGKARVNVNLLLYLINRKFYGK
ncbi:ras GTPase-activating-like protein IQGAP1 [Ornithodoros turicata]|uniref:ras GTPase-activating-like protein IQGAP1 n=1 Tax=Ornithodoros turicata TaxID=34597 RepID=UPI003138BE09